MGRTLDSTSTNSKTMSRKLDLRRKVDQSKNYNVMNVKVMDMSELNVQPS